MTAVAHELPMILTEVEVVAVSRPSPTFVRVELAGSGLADFGVDGPLYDQRIKVVFPNAAGELSSFAGADDSWFATWLERPVEERGAMRTYTVREVLGSGPSTRLVVDVVLHAPPVGPGSVWAASARPGDRLVVLGPRQGVPYGGIEFTPPADADDLLLVGDETALPAIAGILAGLPSHARGHAFVEVPLSADVQSLVGPAGVSLTWLPRDGAPHASLALPAVAAHVAARVAGEAASGGVAAELVPADDAEIDPDLWETPTYSSSGEAIPDSSEAAVLPGLYAWIAGESAMVTTLRRHLVSELGVDRRQVCFMGYWRRGVAMRS